MQPDISVSATETTCHEASDDGNSDEKHQCHHCDLLCKTEKQLKTHVKSKHADQHDSIGGETEKLKCSTCSATFKTSRMLRYGKFVKVHIFWEGQLFVLCTASQIIGGDFAKFCGLLTIYQL